MKACGAKNRRGEPCQRAAMPNGRCSKHGGTSPGAPIRHGRYSLTHRQALAEKVEHFLDDPAPGDLTAELALLRGFLQDYLERFGEHQALRAEDIQFLAGLIREVGAMVERVARILNQTALTAAEVTYLEARLADLLVDYVPDPEARRRFLDELGADRRPARPGLGPPRHLNGDR
jgi:hypothetical protein